MSTATIIILIAGFALIALPGLASLAAVSRWCSLRLLSVLPFGFSCALGFVGHAGCDLRCYEERGPDWIIKQAGG